MSSIEVELKRFWMKANQHRVSLGCPLGHFSEDTTTTVTRFFTAKNFKTLLWNFFEQLYPTGTLESPDCLEGTKIALKP